MRLDDFARTILLGDRLEDKLIDLPAPLGNPQPLDLADAPRSPDRPPPLEPADVPRFPGRPPRLARFGKAEFPAEAELLQPSARGRLLHFFANHELLALELMALALLRFPDAPTEFRAGIARTMAEEQSHLRLYLARMRELGVEFGDLPVSDYFWNAMKDMASPLQYVTQMSLTLEQANLDFSLHYRDAVQRAGDAETAALLERVYREEIGHVKHGVAWFNRWRPEAESDWDAYLRLLPPPMTPRRAKGIGFAAEPRRAAGLSERFVSELEVYTGSKGRPPVFWLYNPLCDAEIARGRPGLNPTEPVRRLGLDLETVPMFLAAETDVVLVDELPRAEWLKRMSELGFTIPEFRRRGRPGESPRDARVGGVEPWGWSPDAFERFRPWRPRLGPMDGANGAWAAGLLGKASFAETGLAPLFSKSWSVEFFREWLLAHPADEACFGELQDAGTVHAGWSGAFRSVSEPGALPLLAKAPWGTSGMQNRRVLDAAELAGPLLGWIRNVIDTQGSVVIEPLLDKVCDLSIQLEVRENETRLLGVRRFVTGPRLEYRGTHLSPTLATLEPGVVRFLHEPQGAESPLERWKALARALGQRLRERGYRGPAGIDALVWKTPEGALRLKPLVELNPRWTMGRVALELEARVQPGTPAAWAFVSAKEARELGLESLAGLASDLEARCPARLQDSSGRPRIREGVVITQDAVRAREILAILAVGERAMECVPG